MRRKNKFCHTELVPGTVY